MNGLKRFINNQSDTFPAKGKLTVHSKDKNIGASILRDTSHDVINDGLAAYFSKNGFDISGAINQLHKDGADIGVQKRLGGGYQNDKFGIHGEYNSFTPEGRAATTSKGISINYSPSRTSGTFSAGLSDSDRDDLAANLNYLLRF